MKFKAAAGETAAMTAAYFAKHKCKECKYAFYWGIYLACAIDTKELGLSRPIIFPDPDHQACDRFIERPAGEKIEQY